MNKLPEDSTKMKEEDNTIKDKDLITKTTEVQDNMTTEVQTCTTNSNNIWVEIKVECQDHTV